MSATGIVSNLVAGVSKLPLARIIDTVGRVQGLLIMLFCVVICPLNIPPFLATQRSTY